LLKPEDYTALVSSLRPAVVQVSGGEPFLRKDVIDIVKAIKKRSNGLPYIVFVTNGSLLNKKKYAELKEAGVDRVSVSLDFPNEKHDEFRQLPGLYAHLEETIPRLAADFGNNDIAMNSAITRLNLPYLIDLANKTEEWGVNISYSAYGILRTGDKSFFIFSQEDLEMLQQKIHQLIQLKKEKGGILNSTYTLMKTYDFFKNGRIPNCNAGRRFLVVRPNGHLIPCSMRPHHQLYSTQEEMLEEFSKPNKCGECYVAIRAYSDKSLGILLKDSLSFFFSN
jgi:MoaA/NifB/PqqE/SkfB family radical SAM enzyme